MTAGNVLATPGPTNLLTSTSKATVGFVKGVVFWSFQKLARAVVGSFGAGFGPPLTTGTSPRSSTPPAVMVSPTPRSSGDAASDVENFTMLIDPYGVPGNVCGFPRLLTFFGTGLMNSVLSTLTAVPSSLVRTMNFPVTAPGVTTAPATAWSAVGTKVMVTGRPAGAVVAVTLTVLPATPSRLGSPELTGPVAETSGPIAGKTGTGASVTDLMPASMIGPDVFLSAGVVVRAAVAVKAVPAPAIDPGDAVILAPRAPTGTIVTPPGAPASVQVSLPLPAAVAVTAADFPTPMSAGAAMAVTTGSVWTTGWAPATGCPASAPSRGAA